MVKSELVRVLNKKIPYIEAKDVELAINCMLEQMMTALEQENVLKSGALVALACTILPLALRVTPKQVQQYSHRPK